MQSDSSLASILFVIPPVAIGLAICYYLLVVVPRQKRQAFQQFADKFGLSYQPHGLTHYAGLLPGRISNVVQGVDSQSNKPVSFFHLYHVTGSGKNRREYHRTVVVATIKKTNLHVYVNSKINDVSEQVSLARSQRYTAEGAFGKYFDLYFPENQEVNSLAVFAPDALRLIMANYGMYDIEIKGNQLYLYDYQFIESSKGMEYFYNLGLTLAKEIDSNAPRVLNLRTAIGAPDSSTVSALKRGTLTPTSVVVILIICIGIFSGQFDSLVSRAAGMQTVGSFAMPVVMVAMVGVVAVAAIRNVKLRRDYQKDRVHFQEEIRKK